MWRALPGPARQRQAAPLSSASAPRGRVWERAARGPPPRPPTRKQIGMEKGVAPSPSPKGPGSFLLLSNPWAIGIRSRVRPGAAPPQPRTRTRPRCSASSPSPFFLSGSSDPPREPPGKRGAAPAASTSLAAEPCSRWHGSPLARLPAGEPRCPRPQSRSSHPPPKSLGSTPFCGNSFRRIAALHLLGHLREELRRAGR